MACVARSSIRASRSGVAQSDQEQCRRKCDLPLSADVAGINVLSLFSVVLRSLYPVDIQPTRQDRYRYKPVPAVSARASGELKSSLALFEFRLASPAREGNGPSFGGEAEAAGSAVSGHDTSKQAPGRPIVPPTLGIEPDSRRRSIPLRESFGPMQPSVGAPRSPTRLARQSALGSRRMVNSMAPSGSSRQLSTPLI